tara:strand:- start:13986 stop:14774 length:789 start_codon:yes stop_codon:yes gene_type:complete
MNFHLPSKKKVPIRRRIFLLSVVSITILFAVNYLTNNRIGDFLTPSTVGVFGINAAAGQALSPLYVYVANKEALIQERDALKERVRQLEWYALQKVILQSENDALRNLAGANDDTGSVSAVRSSLSLFPYGTLAIENKGYATGDAVFAEYGALIGTVMRITENTAIIQLLSAPMNRIEAQIINEETVSPVVLDGIGLGNFKGAVPRDVPVYVGDPVVLPSADSAIIGYVGNITTQPTDAFQTIQVRVPVNLQTVRFVTVQSL